MVHSIKFLKKILIVLMGLLLLFNTNYGAYKSSKAYANTFAQQFMEESLAVTYASVITSLMTVGAGAINVNDFMKESGQEIYDTAKATWPQLSADMQANFKSSLSQMADGIIVAGDWITAALDLLKPQLGGSTVDLPFTSNGSYAIFDKGYKLQVTNARGDTYTADYLYNDYGRDSMSPKIGFTMNGIGYASTLSTPSCADVVSYGTINCAQTKEIFRNAKSLSDLIAYINVFKSTAIVVGVDGTIVDTSTPYNRLDEWLRDVAIPTGNLGVYTPNEAWTNKGYRLGLSADGQQLLTLPDGLPYDPVIHGQYSWLKPLTQVIDGIAGVLDTAIGSWIDITTGKKISDATVTEMASATGVDESTAEFVLIKAKEEEQKREEKENSDEGNLSRAQQRNLETLDNIVEGHLTEKDFSGTLRDLQGNPVSKPGGGYWNHLKEMKDSYRGLNKIKKGLEGSLKNPNLNETERKILQEALDKVNSYTKKIEDLFSGYGGIKRMSIGTTIGEIYNLPSPNVYDDYSLEQWYTELYNKRVEGLSKLDVIRMLEQNILEDLAIKKAIEFLHVDPLTGIKFDGQLMETLLSSDVIKLGKYMEEIKNLVSEVSLKLNDLDWVSIEDKEEYADLITEFQNKITKNR